MGKPIKVTVLVNEDKQVLHRAREYKIHPLREATIIFLISFALISGNTLFIYDNALESKKNEVANGLIRSAKIIAASVDAELHQSIQTRGQEDTPQYEEAVLPLRRALAANKDTFAYVYTMVLKDDTPHFVLDALPNDSDEKSHVMDPYETKEESLIAALTTGTAQAMREPKDDPPWGVLISAYAPIYDKTGQAIGIVGIDMKDETYYERFYPIKRATIRTIVTGFFISFLMGSFAWFARNFILVVNEKRLRLMEEAASKQGTHLETRELPHG